MIYNSEKTIKYQKICKAFTLAETLITLGIIGVVAAMTISIISKNIQNAQLKSVFKKSYANLNNALRLITQENGGIPYACFYGYYEGSTWAINMSECESFFIELKEKLKVAKTYKGAVDGINIPNYAATDSSDFEGGGTSCWGSQTVSKSNPKTAWTLADGSMILSHGSDFTASQAFPTFIIDTNGMKKPNKWGYDLFYLDFNNSTKNTYNTKITDTWCGVYEKDGYRINDIILNK